MSVAMQMRLGDAYEALNQQPSAAAAYSRACTLDGHDVKACLHAGFMLLGLGDYAGAEAEAGLALAADRFNLDAQLLLGNALVGARRFVEAEERLQAAVALAPRDPRAYNALADVQWRRGVAKAAESSLLKAIALDSSSPGSHVTLAQLYFSTERTDEAAARLRAALDADPKDPAANRAYASYLVETNQCSDAEPYWKNVAAQSTDGSGALALADYYVLSARPDDALRVLAPLVVQDRDGAVRTRMASILYDRGDHSKATDLVDKVMAGDPSNVSGLLLKARISLDQHDTASAREYVHQAAITAPEAAAVREMLTSLSAAEKER